MREIPDNETAFSTPIYLHECIYKEEQQVEIIKRLLLKLESTDRKPEDFIKLWKTVVLYSMVFKHPAYYYEEEYRLIFQQSFLHPKDNAEHHKCTLGDRIWRSGKYGLTSHYEYKFEIGRIREIIIGPSAGIYDQMMMRRLISEYKSGGCKVIKSLCPHR